MNNTWVCIASGPSLTHEDCEAVKASGLKTIVTNTTFKLCPWAHALYGADAAWWKVYEKEARSTFKGLMYTASHNYTSIETTPAKTTGNSGLGAISLAAYFGAKKILLLGYDCQYKDGQVHHHEDHPKPLSNAVNYYKWPAQFTKLSEELAEVEIINCSRSTALEAWPLSDIHAELETESASPKAVSLCK